MAENNQTNDIAEMLMRLRQSVESDRAKAEKPEEKEEKREKDEFELQLQEFVNEMRAIEEKAKDAEATEDDEDPWYDEEPEEETEPAEDEEEEDEASFDQDESEEELDILIATADEREDEDDDEDPWLAKKEAVVEEIIEEEPEETVEEEPEEIIEEEPEEIVEEEPEEIVEEEPEEIVEEEVEETVEEEIGEIIGEEVEDEDEILTLEMIAEAEAEDAVEDTDDDESLPSWYEEESKRVAPAERSDELDGEEGETFFDFDDWANGVPPAQPEFDEEEPEEEPYEEEPEEEPYEEEAEEEPYEEEAEEDPYKEELYEGEPEIIEKDPAAPVAVETIIDAVEEIGEFIEDTAYPEEEEPEIDEESLEEELAEVEEAEEGGFDETDLEFLHKIGYAAEFGGEEVVKHNEPQQETYVKEPFGDVAYDNGGEEYVTTAQREKIKAEYAMEKKNALIRIYIAGGAALLLFIYEMLCFSGVTLPWMFNQKLYPLSHAMISLQLLIISAAMSLRMIAKGISDLFSLRVTPYSVGGVSVLLNIIYTVVIAIVHPEKYALFNFMPALAVLFGLAYEYVMALNEEKAFLVSTGEGKPLFALCNDDAEGSPVGDEPSLRAYGTDFNKNFFTRMGKRSSEYKYLSILILSVFVAALIALAAVWIATGNGSEGAKAAILTVNFSLPLGAMGVYCLPMLGAQRSLGGDGAVIGHGAADEYEKTRFVTFDETDLFPSMKTTHVDLKPSGNRHISEVLRKTGRLFSAIGGPLSGMVEIHGDEEDGVEIGGIFDNGITAVVDGASMLAGDATFMQINGVDINAPSDHRDSDSTSEILYISIDGKLAARYYIKYIPDEDFVNAVNMLGDRGISVGIRTRNPGVNSRIIEKRCPALKYKVYTLKSVADDEKDLHSHQSATSSGLVARGKAAYLVYPLIAAISLKKYYKVDMCLRIAFAVIGALTVAVFAFLGRLSDIGSLAAAIYQILWLIPSAIMLLVFKKKRD